MTEAVGPPSTAIPLGYHDPDNPLFSFGIDAWLDPPKAATQIVSNEGLSTPRPFFLENFRLTASPLQWNRYIIVGFFSHLDGAQFDAEWNQKPINLLHRHKIVWYNFMCYVDRHIDIPLELEAWATQVAQPYLLAHKPSFLKINTLDSTWPSAQALSADGDDAGDDWTTVGRTKPPRVGVKKQVTLNEPEHRIRPPAAAPLSASLSPLSSLTTLRRVGILKTKQTPSSLTPQQQSPPREDHRKPAWNPPVPPLVPPQVSLQLATPPTATASFPEEIPPTDASIYSETSTIYPDSRASAKQIKMNDGTQRITIRWTPTAQLSYKDNPRNWTTAALTMLLDLFGNDMGAFYPWGSVSLSNWKSPHSMSEEVLLEYISPKVTYIRATKTFIFAVRFGFSTKTPAKWLTKLETKDAMRKHKVWATVSNSCSTSGNLVIAGYILMKAPNLTQRIKYLKSLLVLLPENIPFFDIIHLKRTPTNQLIHHLAVQCGEHHVEPLSKALSNLLKGSGSALYLPRLLLGNLSPEKISQYFKIHDDYMKSLRSITLTPWIDDLDSLRDEFYDNGDLRKRTSREWALTLTLPATGMNARCDIVNGGYDQVATLLVPRQHYQEILLEVDKYRQRLNPVDRREARFRQTILGFPGIIQIDPSVQEALDLLEKMSSDNVWNHVSPSVRQGGINTAQRKPTPPAAPSVTSHLSQSSDESDSAPPPPPSRKARASRRKVKPAGTNPQEDFSTTHSLLSTATSSNDQAYMELESKLQRVQEQRNSDLQTTKAQLLDIDTKLKHLDPRLDNLEAKAVQSMQYHVDTNNALTAVQSQMTQMMEMMQQIASAAPSKPHNPVSQEAFVFSTQSPIQGDTSFAHHLPVISHASESPVTAGTLLAPIHDTNQQHQGGRSVNSTSSGSQHAQPPPKKHLKRSMPDTMDALTLEYETQEDDKSSSSFGSTPPLYPAPQQMHLPLPPLSLLTQATSMLMEPTDMETVETSPTTLALPDLEDQYKLTDGSTSSDPPSPDGGDNG
ncbi:hypothetical protein MHU86_21203 [Fragilaria crotonensis]|nr:hypothetical protein MHU86_21203 [Fragilaria crotonensis]